MGFVGAHFVFQVGLLKSDRDLTLRLSSVFSFMGKITWPPCQLLETFHSSWKWKQASGPNVESATLQWPSQ